MAWARTPASWRRLRTGAGVGRSGRPLGGQRLHLFDHRPRRGVAVGLQAEALAGHVGGGEGVDRDLQLQLLGDLDRAAAQVGDGLGQQLHVHVVADQGDVVGPIGPEQVAGAADLEVLHGDGHARAEVLVGGDGASRWWEVSVMDRSGG